MRMRDYYYLDVPTHLYNNYKLYNMYKIQSDRYFKI